MKIYKLIKSDNLYSDSRLSLKKDIVTNSEGQEQAFTYITKRNAVLIIALVDNKIIMVSQSRYLVDDYALELPGGAIDEGETPLNTALREIQEETGYHSPETVSHLLTINPLISLTNETIDIFVMNNLTSGKPERESTEFDLKVKLVETSNIHEVLDSQMISAPDMLALYVYLHRTNKKTREV